MLSLFYIKSYSSSISNHTYIPSHSLSSLSKTNFNMILKWYRPQWCFLSLFRCQVLLWLRLYYICMQNPFITITLLPSSLCSSQCTHHIRNAAGQALSCRFMGLSRPDSSCGSLIWLLFHHCLLYRWHFHAIYPDLSMFIVFNLLLNVFIWKHWFCHSCSLARLSHIQLRTNFVSVAVWRLFCHCCCFVSVIVWLVLVLSQLWFDASFCPN